MAEADRRRATRDRWGAVVDARRAGQIDTADAMAAELLGVQVAVPVAERVVPETLPDNVRELLTKLKTAKPGKESRDIRVALRKLGHRGGLRSLS